MKTSEFRVVKTKDGKRYLIHEGHSHRWSSNKEDAMIYTKIEVAQALATKYSGEIEAA
jgi:hypothetical protein